MKIILLQHGDAKPENIDPSRPLTEKGQLQAKKAAEFLKRLPSYPDVIMHSGKKRALETAEIICFALGGIKREERSNLGPNDDVQPFLNEILGETRSILVVGHQPFLGKLASALLKTSVPVVDLTNASPLILSRTEDGFVIDTYIKNEYLR
ncbi:MAG: phosphohistidine phosphatase SixA [Spirochaetes bacterium]|nr:phosphohistidine phosphatase SixA [Spirochaetota bacterium]